MRPARKGARAVEWTGLENRQGRKPLVGSNLALSARPTFIPSSRRRPRNPASVASSGKRRRSSLRCLHIHIGGTGMKTALRIAALTAATGVILGLAVAALGQTAAPAKRLEVAKLTADGNLRKPADLDSWVFLGTSLGMGYNPGSFNAAQPGQFQVVLMEPNAYRHFVKHRSYAPGSMFLLSFYDSDKQQRSINQQRLHSGRPHQLRDSPDRPGAGQGRTGVLHVRRQRHAGPRRCRQATAA